MGGLDSSTTSFGFCHTLNNDNIVDDVDDNCVAES